MPEKNRKPRLPLVASGLLQPKFPLGSRDLFNYPTIFLESHAKILYIG